VKLLGAQEFDKKYWQKLLAKSTGKKKRPPKPKAAGADMTNGRN